MEQQELTTLNVPAMALRGLTIFPNMLLSLDVERTISIQALQRAMENDQEIFMVTQREMSTSGPDEEDLYQIGTLSRVRQILRVSEGTIRVMMEGKCRARLRRLWQTEPYLQVYVELLPETPVKTQGPRLEALLRQTYINVSDHSAVSSRVSEELLATVADSRDPGHLADLIAQTIMLRHQDKQQILEELHPMRRLQKANELLRREIDVAVYEQEIESKVRQHVGQVQREHILREQLRFIRQELGDEEEFVIVVDVYSH